ncbi:HTH domain-containing protein [Frigidibacter sp. MR17.14]|uniref:helix-turn-helix transcriptional regulator n=1 Tax=Frigidibacter sp. MR17.14 TaxID=3126509 RepID=UPI003012B328
MKRDQRLYDIVQQMRDGRLHTAEELAATLGVSVRTIWRDMAILSQTGMPVSGERGLGYILRAPLVLPPTLMTPDELQALVRGLRHVAGDEADSLARPARTLLAKVATLLPQAAIDEGEG